MTPVLPTPAVKNFPMSEFFYPQQRIIRFNTAVGKLANNDGLNFFKNWQRQQDACKLCAQLHREIIGAPTLAAGRLWRGAAHKTALTFDQMGLQTEKSLATKLASKNDDSIATAMLIEGGWFSAPRVIALPGKPLRCVGDLDSYEVQNNAIIPYAIFKDAAGAPHICINVPDLSHLGPFNPYLLACGRLQRFNTDKAQSINLSFELPLREIDAQTVMRLLEETLEKNIRVNSVNIIFEK